MVQHIINWLAEKQAQFIKYLGFFLRYVFLAIPGGGVPSYSSNPDPRPILDHRRTGREGEGGCSLPKFWATQNYWEAQENLGKASFLGRLNDFAIILNYYFLFNLKSA